MGYLNEFALSDGGPDDARFVAAVCSLISVESREMMFGISKFGFRRTDCGPEHLSKCMEICSTYADAAAVSEDSGQITSACHTDAYERLLESAQVVSTEAT